jgi:hypothetical protein
LQVGQGAPDRLRSLVGLGDGEEAVCFINIGSGGRREPQRLRPVPADFVTEWR